MVFAFLWPVTFFHFLRIPNRPVELWSFIVLVDVDERNGTKGTNEANEGIGNASRFAQAYFQHK